MSLWTIDLERLSFADLEVFLATKQPEGARLDYKLQCPGDLAKSIAAFANTLGGILILGVDATKDTNEPIWPPEKGMEVTPGLPDRIVQKATEAVYPPVRVAVSRVIENERLPGHAIVVIRVDESRDAPHAVEKKRKVYVYERMDNKNEPYSLADVDRIKYLMDRRSAVESKRKQSMSEAFAKVDKALESGMNPKCWVSVTPVYPWRPLCQPSECYAYLNEWAEELKRLRCVSASVQRIPDGAFMAVSHRFGTGQYSSTYAAVASVDGTVCIMRTILQIDTQTGLALFVPGESDSKTSDVDLLWGRVGVLIKQLKKFYERPGVQRPGLVSLDLQLRWISGWKLRTSSACSNSPFMDDLYNDSITMTIDEFLSPDQDLKSMKDRLVFGFDLDTPEGM